MLRWKDAKEKVLPPPDYFVAVPAKRLNHQVRNPCQRPLSTENPGESSGVTWLSWNHPVSETGKVHVWIWVDEAAKFTVGHVWAEGQQVGDMDDSRVLELLQESWISVFGRMHTLRTDPEGAWRNREVHERLSDMQMVLDLHPGEASWQACVTANTIGSVTDTMTRIALERPDLKT